MTRLIRAQGINLLSLIFAAAPFGVALVRAVQTGHDMRLLWMATASFVGATATMTVAKRGRRTRIARLASSAGSFLIATLLAGMAARLLGASAAPGIWAVASVFGFCGTLSCILRCSRDLDLNRTGIVGGPIR
jgi:hypothetical protein